MLFERVFSVLCLSLSPDADVGERDHVLRCILAGQLQLPASLPVTGRSESMILLQPFLTCRDRVQGGTLEPQEPLPSRQLYH